METFPEPIAMKPVQAREARRLSWREWVPPAVVLAAIAGIALRQVADPDFWWHVATGRYILSERTIPATDVFSFTATDHLWVTHEWLSDVLLYVGYRAVGLNGLAVIFAGLIAAAFAMVYDRCKAHSAVAAWAVFLGAIASVMTWGVRPQMFSLFFVSLYLYILDRRPSWLWLLPALSLLWANLHSGFVSGLVVLGVVMLADEVGWMAGRKPGQPLLGPGPRRLGLVLLASAICSLATPNGLHSALFPFGTLSNRLIQSYIEEWFSPDFHQSWAWPLLAYWVALLGTFALSRRRAALREVLLVLGASVAALYSCRHVPFLSVVGAPLLAEQAADLLPFGVHGRPARPLPRPMQVVLGVGLAAVAVVVGMRGADMVRSNARLEHRLYPAGALAYMREHGLEGRIFNTYHWGGYLIWQGYRVFIDGRTEVYGDEIVSDYLAVAGVRREWEETLRKHGVELVLIETDSPPAVLLAESGRWRAVYTDEVATLLVSSG